MKVLHPKESRHDVLSLFQEQSCGSSASGLSQSAFVKQVAQPCTSNVCTAAKQPAGM